MKETYKVNLINDNKHELAYKLQESLILLGIDANLGEDKNENEDSIVFDLSEFTENCNSSIDSLIEKVISKLSFDFDELPILVEGESKIVKLLNDKIVVELFKPTIYSFTKNRYGRVDGTDELRAKFTSEVFRRMNAEKNRGGGKNLQNAFLASIYTPQGIIIAQRRVNPGNLEVRVKRYHIGSPVHRYRYTERYATAIRNNAPLMKWDRFDKPVVCFDWRNPLNDDEGNRLSDEPLSDDYASIWIEDIRYAKKLASDTFLWLEKLFHDAGLILIDICFFIDQSGRIIFGEISPDCMRVREGIRHPSLSDSLDKDLWRKGEKDTFLAQSYNRLYNLIFKTNSNLESEQINNKKKEIYHEQNNNKKQEA